MKRADLADSRSIEMFEFGAHEEMWTFQRSIPRVVEGQKFAMWQVLPSGPKLLCEHVCLKLTTSQQ